MCSILHSYRSKLDRGAKKHLKSLLPKVVEGKEWSKAVDVNCKTSQGWIIGKNKVNYKTSQGWIIGKNK